MCTQKIAKDTIMVGSSRQLFQTNESLDARLLTACNTKVLVISPITSGDKNKNHDLRESSQHIKKPLFSIGYFCSMFYATKFNKGHKWQ
jgi:hypothetical protein